MTETNLTGAALGQVLAQLGHHRRNDEEGRALLDGVDELHQRVAGKEYERKHNDDHQADHDFLQIAAHQRTSVVVGDRGRCIIITRRPRTP